MVNTYAISGVTLPLTLRRGQYRFHVLLQPVSGGGKYTRLTFFLWKLFISAILL